MGRYKRQEVIIGTSGQKLISTATILVVGAGGIGSPVLKYLAAAGVGKIIIVDYDKVELSNLHRQIVFNENDIGWYKAEKAKEHLCQLNSSIVIDAYSQKLDAELGLSLFSEVDLIIDGSDNYETRYLINDICVLKEKAFISCSVLKDIIQLVLFDTKNVCYRCLYPKAPPIGMIPNCQEAGVLGTVTGIAGSLTANLALNYLLQLENVQETSMRIFDARNFSMTSLPITPNENCIACKQKKIEVNTPILNKDYGVFSNDISRHDYFLVDIREKKERDNVKLDDDLFFPIKDNFNYEFFLNYKEKKILIYCASGMRSRKFASELRELGVDAYYIKESVVK